MGTPLSRRALNHRFDRIGIVRFDEIELRGISPQFKCELLKLRPLVVSGVITLIPLKRVCWKYPTPALHVRIRNKSE